jgi:hypothetical protein
VIGTSLPSVGGEVAASYGGASARRLNQISYCSTELAKKVVVRARRGEDTKYVKAPACGGSLLGRLVVDGVFGKWVSIINGGGRRMKCPLLAADGARYAELGWCETSRAICLYGSGRCWDYNGR